MTIIAKKLFPCWVCHCGVKSIEKWGAKKGDLWWFYWIN